MLWKVYFLESTRECSRKKTNQYGLVGQNNRKTILFNQRDSNVNCWRIPSHILS